jgi:hypothetical protein
VRPHFLCALALLVLVPHAALAQTPDSAAAPVPVEVVLRQVRADTVAERTPRGAVTRALVAPGWGQVYNREPRKAPVVVAALGGAIGYAVVRQRRYTRDRRAALYAGCLESPGRDPCADAEAARDEWEAAGQPAGPAARSIRDRTRGQRDIAVLGVALVYALQALDAYIAAELADFDVSDDLSVRLLPADAGAALGLRVRL